MKKSNRIKKENYELLFDRIRVAQDNKFFLEQTWIAYTIIEDRLLSLLSNSGGLLNKKNKEIRGISNKITTLNQRYNNNINLRKVLYENILDDLKMWAESRNDLMHALASSKYPIDLISAKIQDVAIKGEKIARELSSRARRLKKIIQR